MSVLCLDFTAKHVKKNEEVGVEISISIGKAKIYKLKIWMLFFFFFYFKLFSSKIWSTKFFKFIEIHENQKPKNIFVVYGVFGKTWQHFHCSGCLDIGSITNSKTDFFEDVLVLKL